MSNQETVALGAYHPGAGRTPPSILIIDDDPTLRESCSSVLTMDGYSVTTCGRGDEARKLLLRRGFDIVLVDLHMSQVSGMELLEFCLEVKPDTLVVVTSRSPSVESSIEALRAGAWDYLPKPFTASHLQILLGRASHAVLAHHEVSATGREHEERFGHSENVILLGRSPAFVQMIRLAERVARTDASVFLTGESGSGKEVIAQFIHHHSRRSKRSMVAVNCAALPETLLESEVFGHVKGAFTGAVRDKPGLLEVADGGTFFLDELTEMSQPIQAKLLRVIQDRVVRRVGSETTDAKVNVRFIAATNRDAREAMEQGILRKDLYYRLSVVPILVPPLRERVEDIPILAEHFLSFYWRRHRERGTALPWFGAAALRALQARHWPGNVRELQNVIEHAVVLLEPGREIKPDDIPHLEGSTNGHGASVLALGADEEYHVARERILGEFEVQYISKLINRAGSNMSYAAQLAGVDRTTLYRLMEKHGVQRNTVVRIG